MTHTPGPWNLLSFGKNLTFLIDSDPSPAHGAGIASVYTTTGEYGDPEAIANARLIAAAPELLEACKMALVALNFWADDEDDGPETDAMTKLAIAIAKAEGESK